MRPDDTTYTILQGEVELIRGGRLSIGVIFANLTGRNFEGLRPSWREGTYENYLAYMEMFLECRIHPEELRRVPAD
jgi:hypothetical protein